MSRTWPPWILMYLTERRHTMTLQDIVSKIRKGERVTITGGRILANLAPAEWLLKSEYFKSKLADKEVDYINIGRLQDLVIHIKE